ncbi:MAG: guanylate kinase [Chitinispirillaceae bacterium]|nr:guanylate kinase [Chitinispirillaceae bacterium]
MNHGKIFVFSAASGAGKNTLIRHVQQSFPGMEYSISATTRRPRPGEIDGKHYFFLTQEAFRERIEQGEFAEWAMVHGHYYGTPRSAIDKAVSSGNHVIMDIDVQGKKKFDEAYPEAIGILILPPNMEELERRLRARKSEDEDTIRLRLENARREMVFAKSDGKYEHTVINDDLERAKNDIAAIVRSYIHG